MKKFEKEIPILVCKLEMVFSPSFMNVMQHLLVHFAWEALIAGPVQYRWIPIERGLKKLKATVHNKARVEGCIVESFALIEISHFSSNNSHTYVTAKNYSRYDVNGYRFRTTKLEKSRPLAATINSGVMTSAYDANDKLVNYYGVLQNIVELVFSGPKELKVVFFECDWFNPRNGTRVDKYGMVEVKHSSRLPSRINSVVLANQAEQVYYLPYPHPSLKAWWVAFKVNPQISAVCQYYKRIKGKNMSKEKGANQIYLTEQQYLQVSVDWIVKDVEAWRWLAKKWSTPEWIASSKSHRENRGKAGPGHRFGADGHYSLARRMEHESGVPPSFMDVFVRSHRGPDPTNPEVLCTEVAREKMMAYGEEMTQRHGPDFDWRQAEIDAEALHASGGGRRHGRYAFGIGVVDYDQSISDRIRHLGVLAPQGQLEIPRHRRRLMQHERRLDIIARLGPDVNLPPFCPPQMSPQQGSTAYLRGGRWYHRAPSHLQGGRWYPRAPKHLRGGWHRRALSQLRGGWHRRALSHLLVGWHRRAPTGFSATSGMDDTPGLPTTFGVDASCCTTLQPVDAITSLAIWITWFGLTPSWPNSRCGRA
ncbi:hypothetical protein U9M48_042663 [Paspalum notatum var. saurae]|uniref:DUF4218 domain-containing protein n=1 Tax=Paspalum notatum var. saurae TaxID=547442 RepID=A0AAQ3XGD7_PASNO